MQVGPLVGDKQWSFKPRDLAHRFNEFGIIAQKRLRINDRPERVLIDSRRCLL